MQRLAGEGIVSAAAAAVGTLAVRRRCGSRARTPSCWSRCSRGRAHPEVQAAILGIEHHDTGGALVECALTPPAPVSEARELLDGVDGADPPQPIAAEELTARVLAAARRAVELEIALGPGAGPALAIISRALTGDPPACPGRWCRRRGRTTTRN